LYDVHDIPTEQGAFQLATVWFLAGLRSGDAWAREVITEVGLWRQYFGYRDHLKKLHVLGI
jgi:hypothetical protein